jgi:hypothetical protein
MTAALFGIAFGVFSVVFIRFVNAERWLYTLGLLCLPAIYLVFALYAGHNQSVVLELAWGAPYIFAGILIALGNLRVSTLLIAVFWLLHGVYDLLHDSLFNNPGVPIWYPALCAGADLVIGSYLLFLSRRLPTLAFRHST